MVYAWPEAEIGMMAADMAAKIMYTDADADTLKAKTEEYKALQSSPLSAAGRGYVDTIIEPADTRKYLRCYLQKGKKDHPKNTEQFSEVKQSEEKD